MGRVPLENLLPARVMWKYFQYIEQEYIPEATVNDFVAPRDVFLN